MSSTNPVAIRTVPAVRGAQSEALMGCLAQLFDIEAQLAGAEALLERARGRVGPADATTIDATLGVSRATIEQVSQLANRMDLAASSAQLARATAEGFVDELQALTDRLDVTRRFARSLKAADRNADLVRADFLYDHAEEIMTETRAAIAAVVGAAGWRDRSRS
jgi:hypothetical protein